MPTLCTLSLIVSLCDELLAYLQLHIPISEAMGISVLEAREELVRLQFPLEANINHRQTAFGGSASSAAILAAWSLLWVRLRSFDGQPRLVIRSNSMEYMQPISSDFVASTLPVESEDWDRFLNGLRRRGMGRIQVRAIVQTKENVCADFTGVFAAIAR